jgi:glycosyltransferase involved in cell wall biosynthesis
MHGHRLLIVVNDLGYFISHRILIANAARHSGFDVHVAFGYSRDEDLKLLREQGTGLHYVPIRRGGMNPITDLRSFFLLWGLFRRLQPDLIHLITIKPVLYGGIVARLTGVPAVVAAMAGLGFVFTRRSGLRIAALHRSVETLFRWALNHPNQILIFQNQYDRDQILSLTRSPLQETRLIRGSGVNLTDCMMLPEPSGTPIVVMAARLLRDKGVVEFVEAARILHRSGISLRFWLVGEPDLENPTSLSKKAIQVWREEGIVEFLGHRKDVPEIYAQAHIVVLPSYREGLPKSLIEAAACGRAVVTTDVPGCRDAIEPGITGLLVPPRDAQALADAIKCLIQDPVLRNSMAEAGRALAEREFDISKVTTAHLQIYMELVDRC